MTDLETQLRTLDIKAPDGASADELHRRAAVRGRRRRWRLVLAAILPLLVVAGFAVVTVARDDPSVEVRTGPDQPDETGIATPQRVLGGVEGVTVEVSPRTGLRDGDLVDVRVEGLEHLPGASLAQCAGDVTEANAAESCDFGAVYVAEAGDPVQVTAVPEQTVSVARTIAIARGSYDCATEAAGCVLAVGPFALPPRGVLVPLEFEDVPDPTPTASITPDTGLQAAQEVTLSVDGLRPNGSFYVYLCETASDDRCGIVQAIANPDRERLSVTSEGDGSLTVTVTARAAIYAVWGRTDCTAVSCAVVVRTEALTPLVEVPFSFADDVVAPVPELRLDPPGPYQDGQVVTVHGTGFPAGLEISGQLAQCPTNLDPALQNRCIYQLIATVPGAGEVVASDGTFTMPARLSACAPEPGCVFAWVIPHGPIVVSVPLEFDDP